MEGSTVCFDPSEAEIGKDEVACYNHPCKCVRTSMTYVIGKCKDMVPQRMDYMQAV